jgi:hypothetical protein
MTQAKLISLGCIGADFIYPHIKYPVSKRINPFFILSSDSRLTKSSVCFYGYQEELFLQETNWILEMRNTSYDESSSI